MTARPSAAVERALAYLVRTGCTPQQAADKYKVNVSSVRRAMERAGIERAPVGRPRKAGE